MRVPLTLRLWWAAQYPLWWVAPDSIAFHNVRVGYARRVVAWLDRKKSFSATKARSMADKMLPCPFCGKPPQVTGSGEGQRGLMIHCLTENCVNPHVSYYDHASALAVWNMRAPFPSTDSGAK